MINLSSLLPEDKRKRKWASMAITMVIAGLLTLWGIYGIGEYGIALFILTPFLIGFSATTLYGYKRDISYGAALNISFLTLLFLMACIFLFALDGLICILMAVLPAMFLTWLGALVAWAMLNKPKASSTNTLLLLIILIPSMGYIEKEQAPDLTSVTTSIEINAAPQEVWKQVIAFPQLKAPEELLFKAGIAYPINATIKGTGVGAVRYCNFTTGSFVEPITIWDEPKLLGFNVLEQPAPMKEISFWDVDAPHLHDYFVSKQGQFKLIDLGNGKTRLEGTTWYYHDIKPAFYWRIWSNYIVHKIHQRVLAHIKTQTEPKQRSELLKECF